MGALEYRERNEGEAEGTYVVYADDMTAERIGDAVRITFWERRREGGKIVKVPILEVVRSGHALKCMCQLLQGESFKPH